MKADIEGLPEGVELVRFASHSQTRCADEEYILTGCGDLAKHGYVTGALMPVVRLAPGYAAFYMIERDTFRVVRAYTEPKVIAVMFIARNEAEEQNIRTAIACFPQKS